MLKISIHITLIIEDDEADTATATAMAMIVAAALMTMTILPLFGVVIAFGRYAPVSHLVENFLLLFLVRKRGREGRGGGVEKTKGGDDRRTRKAAILKGIVHS